MSNKQSSLDFLHVFISLVWIFHAFRGKFLYIFVVVIYTERKFFYINYYLLHSCSQTLHCWNPAWWGNRNFLRHFNKWSSFDCLQKLRMVSRCFTSNWWLRWSSLVWIFQSIIFSFFFLWKLCRFQIFFKSIFAFFFFTTWIFNFLRRSLCLLLIFLIIIANYNLILS